ncbi:MAG: precorrin-3B synthase [Leptolyngbya sp.]|nr:MAG: precorrin-3B synthase [Leptolyngbya sp.]
MNELAQFNVCPGLFHNTPAQDGYLIRIRTPGGWLNCQQGRALTRLIDRWGSKAVQVTNRANLQIRSTHPPTPEVFQTLQNLGLAAQNPSVDHLRNVMTSPTAGIDPLELIDTRPLVQAVDTYIQSHPELAGLPAKFSVGIDGGGAVGIGTRSAIPWEHRYNEIQLSAVWVEHRGRGNREQGIEFNHSKLSASDLSLKKVYFQLALGADKQLCNTSVVIEPDDCVSVVAAIATAYLDYVNQAPKAPKKLRMKHLLQDWGIDPYLQRINAYLPYPLSQPTHRPTLLSTQPYGHLGIHPQQQTGLSYIGISLPLGQLTAAQILGLVQLSETSGSGDLRLTPWQTMLLPDIPNERVNDVVQTLASLGLFVSSDRPDSAIAACAGKPGCAASATETQTHAIALINHLNQQLRLECPVNIHLTGCKKSCAQPSPAEITLLGTTFEQAGAIVEGYHVYIGDDQQSLKHHLGDAIASNIPSLIQQLLHLYQQHQKTPNESFREFTSRYEISDLKSLILSLKLKNLAVRTA